MVAKSPADGYTVLYNTSSIEVFNQRNELVMTYTARRLLAGR